MRFTTPRDVKKETLLFPKITILIYQNSFSKTNKSNAFTIIILVHLLTCCESLLRANYHQLFHEKNVAPNIKWNEIKLEPQEKKVVY